MAAGLQARDYLEAGAGVIGIAGYILMWRMLGRAGWPIAIAIILIIVVMSVFVRERVRANRNRLGPEATLAAKIDADIAVLRRQRDLLHGIWRWYLGPTAASVVIVAGTLSRSRPSWDVGRDPMFLGGFGVFFALVLWFAWEINRHAVRKQVDPRIEELEKLRREVA